MFKEGIELLFCEDSLHRHGCSEELGVVDLAVALVIHILHNRLDALLRHTTVGGILKSLCQLACTDHSCAVDVNILKRLLQVSYLRFVKHSD